MSDYIDRAAKILRAHGISEDEAVKILSTDTNAPGFDLNGHVKMLRNYGISEDDVVGLLAGDTPEPKAIAETGTPVGAVKAMVPMLGAGLGGVGARALGQAVIPRAMAYVGPLVAGAGEAAGAFGGNLAIGQKPKDAAVNALIAGGIGAGTELGAQEVGRGFSRAGRVTPRTMNETLGQGGFQRARTTLAGVGENELIGEARTAASKATKARIETSPGRVAAKAKISAFDTANPDSPIDFAPIKNKILSMVDKRATSTGRIAVNNQLESIAERIPERGSMDDLDFFIREHTEPVKGQVKNLEASLPANVQKSIVSFSRGYRNQLLPEAKADFASASRYLKSTKMLRSMLVDKEGNLKRGVENVWRQIPRNKVILEAFQNFDQVHGTNFADRALDLARRANWSPGDAASALGMVDASVGWLGRAVNTGTRGIGKAFITGAIPAGRSAAGLAAFHQAMTTPIKKQPAPSETP